MTSLHFSRTGAHYYLPVSLNVGTGGLFVRALVDTGASKCSVPKDVNNTYFHLPVVGHDTDVKTATAPQGLDFIQIPRIVVMRETKVPESSRLSSPAGRVGRSMKYRIVIEQDEDGNFVAQCPTLLTPSRIWSRTGCLEPLNQPCP